LVAWGSNIDGESDVPLGNDFVRIAAGKQYSLALIPESSTIVLLALGALALRRRKR